MAKMSFYGYMIYVKVGTGLNTRKGFDEKVARFVLLLKA